MLSVDALEKVRLKDNRLFSDMFNAVLFHGDSNESSYMRLFDINCMRDVIKQYYDDTMPFRLLNYDFINYLNQNKIFHRQKKAVMTIVLNYGERSWNQKIHLKGMMKDIPEEFQEYVNDWQIKVIDIKNVPYQNFHQKENRDLVERI